MIPFVLTILGGYLIGESIKETQSDEKPYEYKPLKLADGGDIDDGGKRLADNPNWTNEKLLAQYNSLKIDLEDLKEGKITPRKIIGGGYKSSAVAKRLAKEWLQNEITRFAKALKIRGVMADGGSVEEENNEMLRSKTKEIKHHADELGKVVKPNTRVDAWVVAKAERSASDLSDITHFLDGKEYADGGMMADGGEISLWKVGGGTAEKLKTGSNRAIQSFLTKNKYKGLQWGDWQSYGLQSWPADATKEEVEKYNKSSRRTATDQEYADGGKLFSRKDKKFRYIGSDGQAHGLNYKLFGVKPDGTKVEISEHTTQAGAERKARIWEKTADGYDSWTIDAVTFANGGKTDHKFVLGVMKSEQIGGKEFLVSGQPVSVVGTMKDAEEKANELIKDGTAVEVKISKYNDKGRLGKVLKTIK